MTEAWLGKGDGTFAKDEAQKLKPLMSGGIADTDLFLSGTGGVEQFLVFRNKLK